MNGYQASEKVQWAKILKIAVPTEVRMLATEYESYRAKVIDACCKLMGEEHRLFWETQCSWEGEFTEKRDPEQVAVDQYEALT